MTAIEKIIIATNTINLMAVQLQLVADDKRVLNREPLVWTRDEDALLECVRYLKDAMEHLGNYVDGHDIIDERTLPMINTAFDLIHDRPEETEE